MINFLFLAVQNLKLKKNLIMKTLLLSMLLLFSTSVFSQVPSASVTDPSIKMEADRITQEYNTHLGLTGIQMPLFKNKVAHYLVLRDQILSDLEGRAQLDALVEMQANETLAMNDILTLIQYRVYKRIKSDIQPLKVVE